MLDFYRTHSPWTEPGKHRPMYDGAGDKIADVVQSVQNVLIHGGLLWLYKVSPSEQQTGGQDIRRTEELLDRIARLDSRPLNAVRPQEARLVVNCRQFAVLTSSILRQKGIPARARAGYALYTWGRGKYENHWICEYWQATERRWVQVDAQLDGKQKDLMRISFDTTDMPEGEFVTAGEGWRRYRNGTVPVEAFGLGGKDGWNGIGWGMVMSNVTCDFMALNKDELLPWDVPPYWSNKKQSEMSLDDMGLLDDLAVCNTDLGAKWSQLRELYRDRDVLHMPKGFDKSARQ